MPNREVACYPVETLRCAFALFFDYCMKPVPPEAPGQLAEREVKFKGSSGKAISAQYRAEL